MASQPKILQPREPILDGIDQEGRAVRDQNGRPPPRQGVSRTWYRFFDQMAKLSGTLLNGLTIPDNSIFKAGDFGQGGTLQLEAIAPNTVLGNSLAIPALALPQQVGSSLLLENGTLSVANLPAGTLSGNAGTAPAPPGAILIGTNLSLDGDTLNASGGGTDTSLDTFPYLQGSNRAELAYLKRAVDDVAVLALLSSNRSNSAVVLVAAGSLFGNSDTIALPGTNIAIGANLLLSGNTLSATGSIAASITVAANSLFGNPGTAAALGSAITIGPNLTLSGLGTLSASTGIGTVVAGAGLSGGGSSSSVTLNLGTIIASSLLGNTDTVAASPTAVTVGSGLSFAAGVLNLGTVAAARLLGNSGTVAAMPTGIAIGANLTLTGGTLSASAPGTGSVTSVVAGNGLNGGTVTTTGTFSVKDLFQGYPIMAVASASASAFAFKGNLIVPSQTVTVSNVGAALDTVVNGASYVAVLAELNGSNVVTAVTGSNTIVASGVLESDYVFDLTAPVVVSPGTNYVAMVGRIDSTGTFALPLLVGGAAGAGYYPGFKKVVVVPRLAANSVTIGATIDVSTATTGMMSLGGWLGT